MKTSNDHLILDCATIDTTDLAAVLGGKKEPLPGPGDRGENTPAYTNKGADPASYCKNGLDTQVDLKNATGKLKTPLGLEVEGNISGTVTVCK